MAFINNINFFSLAVPEYVEAVSEQIHLDACFFGIHRLNRKLLNSFDLDRLVVDIRIRRKQTGFVAFPVGSESGKLTAILLK